MMTVPMHLRFLALLLIALAPFGKSLSFAHHSLTAEFDMKKRVTLTGMVTKIEWTNPHVWIYVDVKDPRSGKVSVWIFQLNSPNALERFGWTRNTLKAGDEVIVDGAPSRDGWTHQASARRIRRPDGQTIPTGYPPDSDGTR